MPAMKSNTRARGKYLARGRKLPVRDIPAALAAHDRAQAVSDEIRLVIGPWTAAGELPEHRRVPENHSIRTWRERLATQKPRKAVVKPRKAKVERAYCVAPSCAHVAIAGSQHCAAHGPNAQPVEWREEARADGSRVNRRVSVNGDVFRMYRRDLLALGTADAMTELERRKAKRAAKVAA